MIKIISLILFSCFLPQSAESKERIFLFDEGYDAAAFKWLHLREAGGEKPVFEKKDTSVKKTGESSIRGELTTAGQSIDWTTVDYPVKPDTVYAVSLWVKTDNARFMLRQNPRTAAGERVEGGMRNIAQLIGNKEWTKVETKIKTDAATERMSFTFFFHTMSGEGAGGSVWVDGIAFRQEVVEVGNEIEFRLHINHYMDDKVYYAAENEPVVMLMTARNNANHKWNNPRFRLLLPEGIHMLGSDYDARPYAAAVAITHEGRPYRLYEYTVPLPRNTLINVNYDQASLRSMALALRAEMKPSDTLHDAYIWYIDDEIECHTYHFHIKITESIFDSIPIQTPTLFSSTASIPFSLELTGPALQEMAAHYAACGFNGVSIPQFLRAGSETGSSREPIELIREFKKQNQRISIVNNSLYNGYMLRYVKTDTPIPDSVLIKKADGTYWNGPAELSFDPAYIYRKGPLWVERLNHLLAQIRDWGGEDLVANWEPYMYSREHGSFTEASMRDFAAHLEVSYDAIKDMAPATILAHYEKELLAFRSWQHGQVVKTIMECLADFNEPNRTSIRFIPWLGTEAITYDYEDPRIRTSQLSCHGSHTVEYLDVASSWHYTHIDYFEYADKRELYDLGLRRGDVAPLDRMDYSPNFYRTERRVAWVTQTRALKGRGPIPYYHLTQNNHLTSKVVLPDEIEHQILASFAAGASGVNMYYFPMGYDSRYWHSAARAFNRIATYEDFVLKGEKVDVCTVTPLSKTYRNDALAERSGIEGEAYSYAARAYSLDGRLLIALCNFSLRDDVVLHVAISGEPSGKVALHDPHQGTHYSYLGQAYLPAEKWQSGIVFRLPKKTIQFYVVESHDPQSTYGRALDLAQSEKKATESIRELNRVFDQRENRLKALLEGASASAVFNAEDVEPFSEGEISAQMIALDGAPVYQVKTSVQEIRIDPSDGAVIRSWRSGSDDLVLRRDTEGGFCRDRFWLPAGCANLAELSGMYRFARHALEGQEWKVTFTQTIHHPAMRNFMMEKTFIIPESSAGFTVDYVITNAGSESVHTGFWIKNNPAYLDKRMYENVDLVIGGKTIAYENIQGSVNRFRPEGVSIASGVEAVLQRVFKNRTPERVPGTRLKLTAEGRSLGMEPDAEKVYEYMTWSTARMDHITLELLLKPVLLAPGDRWMFQINYSFDR